MRCSSCGEHVPNVYDFCLQCGFPVNRQPTTASLNSSAQSVHHQSFQAKQPRIIRPLVVMLAVGALVIAGIVLMITLSKSGDTVSTEQAEVDVPPANSRTRSNNPPPQTNDDESISPQSSLPRITPSPSPQTEGTLNENTLTSPSITYGGRLVPGSFFVPARRYYFTKFNIPAQSNRSVVGNFRASGGSGNDIEVLIVDEDGFKNFANKQGVRTYYNSGKLSIGNINVRLQPGTYYIIFNNNFSLLSNKNIATEITLKD